MDIKNRCENMRVEMMGFAGRMMIVLLTVLIVIAAFSTNVYADIASGTSGTCSWVIDDSGVLTISPTDGVSGTLASYTGSDWPWYSYKTQITKVVVDPGVSTGAGCDYLFSYFTNCTEMDLVNLDTSNVTNMEYMFSFCSSLTNLNLSGWDTGKVTNMQGMFHNCSKFTSLDLSWLNTSNATNMQSMFRSCTSLTSLDVSGFDTSNVTTMTTMFAECTKLTSLDLSGFDTSKVTTMNSMFNNCRSLTSLELSGWDTGNATNMNGMFDHCDKLSEVTLGENFRFKGNGSALCALRTPDGYLGWQKADKTSPILTTQELRNQYDANASNWAGTWVLVAEQGSWWHIDENNTLVIGIGSEMTIPITSVSSMSSWPWNSERSSIQSVRFDGIVHCGASAAYMFSGMPNCTSIDMTGFDTSNVTNMRNMFASCNLITSLDLSGFNTSKVTNMQEMFYGCDGLRSLDLTGWDTAKVTTMKQMFKNCKALNDLILSGWNTSNVTNVACMFQDCQNLDLSNVDIHTWNLSKVQSMNYMFCRCYATTSLDLSGWNVSNVTTMQSTFKQCNHMESLDLSSWNTSKVTNFGAASSDAENMFYGCSVLKQVKLGQNFKFTGNNITATTRKALLPTPSGTDYTGKWVKEDLTAGPVTATELRDQFDANAALWQGTWIWEEIPTKYTLIFTADPECVGSMPNQKIVAAEDGTINPIAFARRNYSFDHWTVAGSNPEITYVDQATIPAGTYAIGDKITLNAVFVYAPPTAEIQNGEFEITLRGGEQATIHELPAGASYQVWEETPDGWVLVQQTNTNGEIVALQSAKSDFQNEYTPGTTTVTLHGTKIFENSAAPADGFKFVLLENDTEIEQVTNGASGMISFSTITYDTPGTHVYTIQELTNYIGDDVDYETSEISWDTHEETVTVEVTEDESHNLHTTVTYDEDGVTFNNTLKPAVLTVTKRAEGLTEANEDTEFTFKITLTNPNGTLAGDGTYYWYTEPAA